MRRVLASLMFVAGCGGRVSVGDSQTPSPDAVTTALDDATNTDTSGTDTSDVGASDVAADTPSPSESAEFVPKKLVGAIWSGCALSETGTVACFGDFRVTEDVEAAWMHAIRLDIDHVVQVSSISGNTCVVRDDGAVWCHGFSACDDTWVASMRRTTLPTAAVEVIAGMNGTCARLNDGNVACWGGTLGITGGYHSCTPVIVPAAKGAVQLAPLIQGWVARMPDGTILRWGTEEIPDMSGGTIGVVRGPHTVEGFTDAKEIASDGQTYACALVHGGEVRCFGRFYPFETMTGFEGTTHLTVVDDGLCGMDASGSVRCAGQYLVPGAVGESPKRSDAEPIGLEGVSDFIGFVNNGCFRKEGKIACWGEPIPPSKVWFSPPVEVTF